MTAFIAIAIIYGIIGVGMVLRTGTRGWYEDLWFAGAWPYFVIRHWRTDQ